MTHRDRVTRQNARQPQIQNKHRAQTQHENRDAFYENGCPNKNILERFALLLQLHCPLSNIKRTFRLKFVFFARFSLKIVWQIWRPTSPNLNFSRTLVPKIQFRLPFGKTFSLKNFARVPNYKQNFKKLLLICNILTWKRQDVVNSNLVRMHFRLSPTFWSTVKNLTWMPL